MQTIRADSSEIMEKFAEWLAVERVKGARLVVLEGLMGSGKSWLVMPSSTEQLLTVELDTFLDKPVPQSVLYMDAIDLDGVATALQIGLQTSALVIAEGPVGWPATARTREKLPAEMIRRVYLKRMAPRNPDDWEALEFAEENPRPTAFGRSIDLYHLTEKPWLIADLVLERTGGD